MLIAATRKIESVDEEVRNCFSERNLGMPNEKAREAILRKLCSNVWAIPDDYDFLTLAKLTPAFVAGDLDKLVSAALFSTRRRLRE